MARSGVTGSGAHHAIAGPCEGQSSPAFVATTPSAGPPRKKLDGLQAYTQNATRAARRSALGARRSDVVFLMLREGWPSIALGIVLGTAPGAKDRWEVAAGDSARGLAMLEQLQWSRVGRMAATEPLDRLLHADLLAATGRLEDALRWYATIGDGSPQELPLVGFAAMVWHVWPLSPEGCSTSRSVAGSIRSGRASAGVG